MGVGEARTRCDCSVCAKRNERNNNICRKYIKNATSAMLTTRTARRRPSVNCINNITSAKSGPRVYYNIRAVTGGQKLHLCAAHPVLYNTVYIILH